MKTAWLAAALLCLSAPLAAQKTAPPIVLDRDRDGVPDLRDRCLLTAGGVRVGTNGCPSSAPDSVRPPAITPAATQAPTSTEQFFQGRIDGRRQGDQVNTSGRMVGGLAAGTFLGLIGTGIVYAVASGDAVRMPDDVEASRSRDTGYLMGFEEGYVERVRARRRSSALAGGLLGTGIAVLIIVSINGN